MKSRVLQKLDGRSKEAVSGEMSSGSFARSTVTCWKELLRQKVQFLHTGHAALDNPFKSPDTLCGLGFAARPHTKAFREPQIGVQGLLVLFCFVQLCRSTDHYYNV